MIRIVKELTEKLNVPVIPVETNKVQNCVVYQWYGVALYNYRLQLRVIAESFDKCEEISKEVMKTINDFGDLNKVKGIASVELNGGGSLKDNQTNTIQRIMYFDIVTKG